MNPKLAIRTSSPEAIATYQRALDRVYLRSADLLPEAPNWQAGLYQSVRACYGEMSSNNDTLAMHFMAGAKNSEVQKTRRRHRDRLIELLAHTRSDAPPRVQAEMLLTMIHGEIRRQIEEHGEPLDVDTAEHTFATFLFNATPPPA
jgi:hypothetical protein